GNPAGIALYSTDTHAIITQQGIICSLFELHNPMYAVEYLHAQEREAIAEIRAGSDAVYYRIITDSAPGAAPELYLTLAAAAVRLNGLTARYPNSFYRCEHGAWRVPGSELQRA